LDYRIQDKVIFPSTSISRQFPKINPNLNLGKARTFEAQIISMFWNKKEKSKAPHITDQSFKEIVENTDKGILLDFYAKWCGPCKVLSPIIDELAGEFGDRVIIAKVDSETNPQLSTFFKVKSIPTLIFIKDQKLIEVINGLVPKPNLEEMIEDLIAYEFPKEEEEE